MRLNSSTLWLAACLACGVPTLANAANVTFEDADIFAFGTLDVFAGPASDGGFDMQRNPGGFYSVDSLAKTPLVASYDSSFSTSTSGANALASMSFNGVGTFASAAQGNFVLSGTSDTTAFATAGAGLIAFAGADFEFPVQADYEFDVSQTSVITVTYTGDADPMFVSPSGTYSIYDVTSDGAGNGSFSALLSPGMFDLQGTIPGIDAGSYSDDGMTNVDHASGNSSFAFAIGAVPEPATWTLMLAGFGAVGIVLRSRRPVDRIAGA